MEPLHQLAHPRLCESAAFIALVAVCLVVGVSEAFVAPSASPPLAGGSAASKIDGHGRGCDARLGRSSSTGGGGGLSMSADGDATQGRRRHARIPCVITKTDSALLWIDI